MNLAKLKSWLAVSSLAVMALALTMVFSAQTAQASHFRYGDISWKVISGNTIEFKIKQAWRNFGAFVVGDTFVATNLNFGDGTPPVGVNITVTTVDGPANWVFGDFTVQHTYASAGNKLAFFDGCCRIGVFDEALNFHVNNPDRSERVETRVNVGTVDGGNDSAVTTVPVIVNCEELSPCSFGVTAADPDGDPLNWRLSESAEAVQGGTFTQPSGAAVDANTGQYTWNTPERHCTSGDDPCSTYSPHTLYSTQVTVEELDFAGALISKVAVDFLIELVEDLGEAPTFDSLVCGTTQVVAAGSALNFTVSASDIDVGDMVVLNAVGMPGSATTANDPLGTAGNPISTDFSWTPGAGDVGITVVAFTATDTNNLQDLCPVTIEVIEISANAGLDQTVGELTSPVCLDGTASQPADADYSWVQTSGDPVILDDSTSAEPCFDAPAVGANTTLTFELTVTNPATGDTDTDSVNVNVQNTNDAPVCSSATPSVAILWPPNHKMVGVTVGGVTDTEGDPLIITVTGITQDEPTNGLGDGDTGPDGSNLGSSADLRAERSGLEDGRVYSISFDASDGMESCSGNIAVGVPHSRKSTPVDSGQDYDSEI